MVAIKNNTDRYIFKYEKYPWAIFMYKIFM